MRIHIFIMDEGDTVLVDRSFGVSVDVAMNGDKVPNVPHIQQAVEDMAWEAVNPKKF
jgi:hypothetical protein